MPVIPSYTPPAGRVIAGAIYENALYAPAIPADTAEVLSGGLDNASYTGGDDSIPMSVIQSGTFAAAFYAGFDRWEFLYARQFNNDGNRGGTLTNRQIVAGLAATFTLPWTASLLFIGYQAFCRHDATVWDNDGNSIGRTPEWWDLRVHTDSSELTNLYARLPAGRVSNVGPSVASAEPFVSPGYHAENRWRWESKFQMIASGGMLTKGRHRLRVSGWPAIYAEDNTLAKCVIPTGGITVIALR